MNLDIKNLMHVERDVAKHIKSTKKLFIWEFLLDGKSHKIELFDSRLSGKKKVLKDGLILMQTEEDVAFIKTFDIGKHHCTLIQHGEKYELRIDNQSFNHLMDLEKNKMYFKNTVPTSTSFVTKPVAKEENKLGFGLSMVNIAKSSENKQPLFNFTIKPASETTMQPKRFNFSLNDKNNKGELSSKQTNNVQTLIEIPDCIDEVTTQVAKESKMNIIDLNKMELMGEDNNDIFQIVPYNENKIQENKQSYGIMELDTINKNNNSNKGNDLLNTIENLYKEGGNSNRYQNPYYNQQTNFNPMFGVPQIGDGNINYQYNPYMNSPYGQMVQPGNQMDMYNQFNVSAYSYNANNQSDVFLQSSSTASINMNNQQPKAYPSDQSGSNQNISGGNLNKNSNSDPLSELFG